MAVVITFDGENKEITISDSGSTLVVVTGKEMYSRWKEWVISNSQYEPAFRTVGGDPIGGGLFIGDYYFVNNVAGWRIKPEEKHHTLQINGNVYSEDPLTTLFLTTNGGYTVNIQQQVSQLTQTLAVNSGSGLDSTQDNKLTLINNKVNELFRLHGLEIGNDLIVTTDRRYISDESIDQSITKLGNTVTITRV